MNTRQKAKKYRKQMDLYKYKADILDDLMKNDMKQRAVSRQLQGEIIPLRFQRLYRTDQYVHHQAIKNELARQIGEYLIDNNLLYVKSSIDERYDMIKLDCRLEVIKIVPNKEVTNE